MDLELDPADRDLQEKARDFTQQVLIPKELHALASAVKLVCSETAGRIVDRAVQIHRLVIGNELRKRGPGLFTGWVRIT